MGKLFNPDSPIMQALIKISDLVVLNFLTVLLCIPIFTIGAAVTALYDAIARMMREEGGIYKAYFKAFTSNFKQATAQWLLLLISGAMLAAGIYFYANTTLATGRILLLIATILALLWCAVAAWVFPLQSRFYNPVKATFRNALLCALAYLPRTMVMIVLNMLPWVLAVVYPVFFIRSSVVFIAIWFSMAANVNLQVIKAPFKKMMEQIDPEAAAAMDAPSNNPED